MSEARPQIVVTQESLIEWIPESEARVVCTDTHADAINAERDDDLPTDATAENLIYVLFTSGSTGNPKGVAVEHRQMVNYLDTIIEKLALPTGASYALVSTIAADLGNTVIFPSLCTGGRLHIISFERVSDAESLSEYFRHHPIDCLKIVPSHLSALMVSSQAQYLLPRLRLVLGGETLAPDLVNNIKRLAPGCAIFNHYGPTETTVGVLVNKLADEYQPGSHPTVPLGRPIANAQIYLLDFHLRPVPIGVPGQIYIGGEGLARGYLCRPDQTAERFIPDSFSRKPGARLYRTGDLARFRSDLSIEFLGRTDRQIKVRGHRIELEEIEAVLLQHPAVSAAHVLVQETPADKRLVAYVVPAAASFDNEMEQLASSVQASAGSREQGNKGGLSLSELQSYLSDRLPIFMMPAAFIMIDRMPLTPNGKIDRQALLARHATRPDLAEAFVPPTTSTEQALAKLWSDLLQTERVGIRDNFFQLGGHSLLATQLMSRVREAFNVEIPLRKLFEKPTIAALAEVIEASQSEWRTAQDELLDMINDMSEEEASALLEELSES